MTRKTVSTRLNPCSVRCTFLYPRCPIEDPGIGDSGSVVPLVVNSDTKSKRLHAVIILRRFDHHSLYHICCFNSLSLLGLFPFSAMLSCTHCSPFASVQACCTRETPKVLHQQAWSIQLELRLTGVWEQTTLEWGNWPLATSQLSHMTRELVELSWMKQWHRCLVAFHALSVSSTEILQGLRSTVETSNRASPLRTELPISTGIHVLHQHVLPAKYLLLHTPWFSYHIHPTATIRTVSTWRHSLQLLAVCGKPRWLHLHLSCPINTGVGHLHVHPRGCRLSHSNPYSIPYSNPCSNPCSKRHLKRLSKTHLNSKPRSKRFSSQHSSRFRNTILELRIKVPWLAWLDVNANVEVSMKLSHSCQHLAILLAILAWHRLCYWLCYRLCYRLISSSLVSLNDTLLHQWIRLHCPVTHVTELRYQSVEIEQISNMWWLWCLLFLAWTQKGCDEQSWKMQIRCLTTTSTWTSVQSEQCTE